jgi:DNA polymerase I
VVASARLWPILAAWLARRAGGAEKIGLFADGAHHVYDGRTFKMDRFEAYLAMANIPMPRLASGKLDLDKDTFEDMGVIYPVTSDLAQLRHSLSSMRLSKIAVGKDGRNRTMLSAFGARSGRNTPSTDEFLFGPSIWLRGLVMPSDGYGCAYIDWSQQEFGIAADLSGDPAMLSAYKDVDPYMAFAKQARAAPLDATKATHGAVRDLYKTCVLGVQYGMGKNTLAYRIKSPPILAGELLRAHHETYPRFWRWS